MYKFANSNPVGNYDVLGQYAAKYHGRYAYVDTLYSLRTKDVFTYCRIHFHTHVPDYELSAAVCTCDTWNFLVWMHSMQDSFPHRPWLCPWTFGHVLAGHWPDYPNMPPVGGKQKKYNSMQRLTGDWENAWIWECGSLPVFVSCSPHGAVSVHEDIAGDVISFAARYGISCAQR